MTPHDLLDEATAAGLTLIPNGDRLRVRGPEPMPAELLDALRERKPEILAELRARQEREREAVAGDLWSQLADLHRRAGCPCGWLTSDVREAEAQAEAAWLRAREHGTEGAHLAAVDSLQVWWTIASAAVVDAADRVPA